MSEIIIIVRKVHLGCYLFKNYEVRENLARKNVQTHCRDALAKELTLLLPRALNSTGEEPDASATMVLKRSALPTSWAQAIWTNLDWEHSRKCHLNLSNFYDMRTHIRRWCQISYLIIFATPTKCKTEGIMNFFFWANRKQLSVAYRCFLWNLGCWKE